MDASELDGLSTTNLAQLYEVMRFAPRSEEVDRVREAFAARVRFEGLVRRGAWGWVWDRGEADLKRVRIDTNPERHTSAANRRRAQKRGATVTMIGARNRGRQVRRMR